MHTIQKDRLTPSLDEIFRGYVRYPALSGVIWRYLALSRAISRNLAQFGPFQSQNFSSPAAGV